MPSMILEGSRLANLTEIRTSRNRLASPMPSGIIPPHEGAKRKRPSTAGEPRSFMDRGPAYARGSHVYDLFFIRINQGLAPAGASIMARICDDGNMAGGRDELPADRTAPPWLGRELETPTRILDSAAGGTWPATSVHARPSNIPGIGRPCGPLPADRLQAEPRPKGDLDKQGRIQTTTGKTGLQGRQV